MYVCEFCLYCYVCVCVEHEAGPDTDLVSQMMQEALDHSYASIRKTRSKYVHCAVLLCLYIGLEFLFIFLSSFLQFRSDL